MEVGGVPGLAQAEAEVQRLRLQLVGEGQRLQELCHPVGPVLLTSRSGRTGPVGGHGGQDASEVRGERLGGGVPDADAGLVVRVGQQRTRLDAGGREGQPCVADPPAWNQSVEAGRGRRPAEPQEGRLLPAPPLRRRWTVTQSGGGILVWVVEPSQYLVPQALRRDARVVRVMEAEDAVAVGVLRREGGLPVSDRGQLGEIPRAVGGAAPGVERQLPAEPPVRPARSGYRTGDRGGVVIGQVVALDDPLLLHPPVPAPGHQPAVRHRGDGGGAVRPLDHPGQAVGQRPVEMDAGPEPEVLAEVREILVPIQTGGHITVGKPGEVVVRSPHIEIVGRTQCAEVDRYDQRSADAHRSSAAEVAHATTIIPCNTVPPESSCWPNGVSPRSASVNVVGKQPCKSAVD